MSDLLRKCKVCRGLLDEEDLFCANCGTEAPHADDVQAGRTTTSTHNFECTGCGASMSFDASAGSLRCPFCGSEKLHQKKDSKALAPERIVPFKVTKNSAVERMRTWLGNGFWRPGDLSSAALVVSMTPVYVPYWVFEAQTHTFWTGDTNQTPYGARGDWFPMSGEHRGSYAALLVGASGALTPRETAEICPFDLADGVDAERVDTRNVTLEQFSVPRKYARPLARQGIEQYETNACRAKYIPGKSRNVKVNLRIEGLSSEPVLLPVWIMAYRYKGKVFRFLMNGQTGKSTGTAPFSYKKLFTIIGSVLLAILVVFCLIGVLGGR